MNKILRLLTVCLMLLALPVQSMAVISMQNCMSLDMQPSASASTASQMSPQCESLQSSMLDAGHQQDTLISQLCMHCSMCLSAAILPTSLGKPGIFKAAHPLVQSSPQFAGHISDLPKRPPRTNLV
ncbi:hypothetical protein [Pseudomonas sp. M30-35]|uniref:hypothetical protein n=1 Tax=Pseudomonas sp. M30-35 TaxID=1981174 RepID=UPI000B3CB21C|nr:hypothetical protein [Pseudomonas sp. M30-35]ARU88690.1 hypothetical protein B9K09_12255 [Pseudomonas sp. M30-35]